MKECKHTEGLYHDCEYVDFRQKLIARAVYHAYSVVGSQPKPGVNSDWRTKYSNKWNRAFHDRMSELVAEATKGVNHGDEKAA